MCKGLDFILRCRKFIGQEPIGEFPYRPRWLFWCPECDDLWFPEKEIKTERLGTYDEHGMVLDGHLCLSCEKNNFKTINSKGD